MCCHACWVGFFTDSPAHDFFCASARQSPRADPPTNPPTPPPTYPHPPPPPCRSIMLNELTPGLDGRVAPTDCRLRPDQHCLELGQYDQVGGVARGCWPGRLVCIKCARVAVRVGVAAACSYAPSTLYPSRPVSLLPTLPRPPHPPLLAPSRQANHEKQRLEHKQRAARKAAERGEPIRPRWCAPHCLRMACLARCHTSACQSGSSLRVGQPAGQTTCI